MATYDPKYIVFIRVPFPRGSFVDPPFVEWNAAKEKQLWKILSNTSKNYVIDSCLYEQQMQQVQAQIRKVRDAKGLSLSPVLSSSKSDSSKEVVKGNQTAVAVTRETNTSVKSGPSSGIRVSSALSNRKDMTTPTVLNNMTRTISPSISRRNSINTPIQSLRINPSSPRSVCSTLKHESTSPKLEDKSGSRAMTRARLLSYDTHSSSEYNSMESSSDVELSSLKPAFRRLSRITQKLKQPKYEEEDDDELVFMPLAMGSKQHVNVKTMTDSSDNKKGLFEINTSTNFAHQAEIPNSLMRNNVSLTNNYSQIKGKCREENTRTPSMGSSFSDLDDTSLTQSALEEALASNMQAGSMASKMSSISQALKSEREE